MIRLLQDPSGKALEWAAHELRTPAVVFHPNVSFVVMDNSELLAVIVCHEYRESDDGNSLDVSVVARRRGWATRRILKQLFEYGFDTCKCVRVGLQIAETNKNAIDIATRLGFRQEARLRKAQDGKRDKLVFGMLRDECHWLSKPKRHKKKQNVVYLEKGLLAAAPIA